MDVFGPCRAMRERGQVAPFFSGVSESSFYTATTEHKSLDPLGNGLPGGLRGQIDRIPQLPRQAHRQALHGARSVTLCQLPETEKSNGALRCRD